MMNFPGPKLHPRTVPATQPRPDLYQEALDQDQHEAIAGLQAAKLGLLKARTDAERERYGAEIAKYRAETRLSQEQLARVESGEPGQTGALSVGGLVSRMLDKTEQKVDQLEGQLGDLSGQLVESQLGTLQTQIAELKTKMANPATAPSLADIMAQVQTWNGMVRQAAQEIAESRPQTAVQPPAQDPMVVLQLKQLEIQMQANQQAHELRLVELQNEIARGNKQHDLDLVKYKMERDDKKDERAERRTQNREMLGKAEEILGALAPFFGGEAPARALRKPASEEPESQVINAICSTEGCGEKFPVERGANPVTCPKCHQEQSLEWPEEAHAQ